MAETFRVDVLDHAGKQRTRLTGRQPSAFDGGLREKRHRPSPYRAVVVGGLAARVLIACVSPAIFRVLRGQRPYAAGNQAP